MKHHEGKKCKIHIQRDGKDLYYEADVLSVDESHITFVDKFGKEYTFRRDDIIEIRTL